jgi:hypothetical protein
LSVPSIRSRFVTAKLRSKWRGSMSRMAVSWWMTTSGEASRTAATTCARSSASAMTGTAPIWVTFALSDSLRIIADTSCPAAARRGTSC